MTAKNDKKFNELIRLGIELNEVQDADLLMEKILLRARRFLNADAGSIMIRDKNELIFSHSQNDTQQSKLPEGEKLIYHIFRTRISESSISGYVALTGKILNIENAYNIPEDAPYKFNHSYDDVTEYKTVSILTVPLQTLKKEIIGVMQIINAKDADGNIIPFDKEDELYVLNFANNASMILQRALMTRALILRMINMAELRDPMETGAHVNRVASYTIELYERWALKKNISRTEIENNIDILRLAAMLHDVGKVAISDLLLKKPARFTKEEYEIIKKHTIYGAILFKMKQSDFDEISAIVALNHHENWDGTGYPGHVDIDTGAPLKVDKNGLPIPKKGEEIPIFGRIVALADVFDALSSKRVYKDAWDKNDVLNEIKNLRGKKFDPELVDIFLDNIQVFENIKNKYKEA
jgi:HD-GYP domain-containing protein (c-di-GMP phosphodiesterase class II)